MLYKSNWEMYISVNDKDNSLTLMVIGFAQSDRVQKIFLSYSSTIYVIVSTYYINGQLDIRLAN
jgi:hypothetical protein